MHSETWLRNFLIGMSIYAVIGVVLFGWANNHPKFCYTIETSSGRIFHDLCPAYFALWWPITVPAYFSDKLWKMHNEK